MWQNCTPTRILQLFLLRWQVNRSMKTTALVEEEVVGMLTGLMEVILQVKDMNVEVAFYRDMLGLRVTYPEGAVDYSKEGWVTFETGRCVLALHDGGRVRQGETPS